PPKGMHIGVNASSLPLTASGSVDVLRLNGKYYVYPTIGFGLGGPWSKSAPPDQTSYSLNVGPIYTNANNPGDYGAFFVGGGVEVIAPKGIGGYYTGAVNPLDTSIHAHSAGLAVGSPGVHTTGSGAAGFTFTPPTGIAVPEWAVAVVSPGSYLLLEAASLF